jgi:hypothetical protein
MAVIAAQKACWVCSARAAVSETCATDGLQRRQAALGEPIAIRQALEQVDQYVGGANACFVSRYFRFSHRSRWIF